VHIIIHCSAYCLSIDQSLLKLGSALLPLNVFVAGLSSSPLLRGRKILSACPMITSCLNDLCHVSPACLALSPSSVVDPTVLQSWTSALMSKLFQSLMLANLKHCWHLLPIGAQLPLPLYYGLVSKTLTYMSFSDLLGSITVYYLICIGHIIENIHKMANKQRRCTRSIRTAHEIFILIGMWVCVCVCAAFRSRCWQSRNSLQCSMTVLPIYLCTKIPIPRHCQWTWHITNACLYFS